LIKIIPENRTSRNNRCTTVTKTIWIYKCAESELFQYLRHTVITLSFGIISQVRAIINGISFWKLRRAANEFTESSHCVFLTEIIYCSRRLYPPARLRTISVINSNREKLITTLSREYTNIAGPNVFSHEIFRRRERDGEMNNKRE